MRLENKDSYISFIFDLGQKIDLKKVAKSKLFLKMSEEDNFLFSIVGDKLYFIVFKSGKVRITYPDGDLVSLQKSVSEFAVQINALFTELKEKAGIKTDLTSILSRGKIEEKDFEAQICVSIDSESIPLYIFRDLSIYSPSQMFGEYNYERLQTFSGEKFGRGIKAGSKSDLEKKLKEFIESNNLGLVEVLKPEKDELGKEPFSSFRIYKSKFVYGLPPTGKAECYFIQALIRGAFAEYLKQENINVVETKCWRKGNVFCEFNVYLLSH